ncbi:MAG: Conserved cytoplasmic membrane protein, CmpX protein [Candidatus Nomurabacteria bacterium GW2011_GWB1_37_5]|uniref:Conserved cytoplasmic membrane protein, CmpX protein n=1 Tax=Candidatus Nomurabacteria bacterium GW2011_GWB1_37_5 TaxID=1618742 RepID=A0A0G0H8T3_9BACT|nr:MAG: Conserved cytoplasmic membrane protein, CmpX protein [Candidatus Nomurabacteria bacterium GW2011_GWB1_37_5]
MIFQTWGQVFSASLQNLWLGFIGFVPALIVAIVLFIIGWVLGGVIGKAIAQLLEALKIDKFFQSIGTEQMLGKAGFKLNVGRFVGEIVRWFIIIVFLVASLDILGLQEVNNFLREVVLSYIPKVFIAALILVLAAVVSDAASKIVSGFARAAQIRAAGFLGTATRYAVWVFALIIALSELGIAQQFMQILFTGIVATMVIAVGLAFGLGAKDAAGKAIEKVRDQVNG